MAYITRVQNLIHFKVESIEGQEAKFNHPFMQKKP